MDKYIKTGVAIINDNQAGYISAKKRKKERNRLNQLFKDVEDLKLRIAALENSDK